MIDINTISSKYNMDSLESFVEQSEDNEQFAKILWYQTFLDLTDHIPLQLMEGNLSTDDCKEELAARELARKEIATLQGNSYTTKENYKTIDERTQLLESNGLESVIDHECRISLLELGIKE